MPKPPVIMTVRAHRRRTSRPPWRYTTQKPADDWFKPGFDDCAWKEGTRRLRHARHARRASSAPSGTRRDIWLRREFTLPDGASSATCSSASTTTRTREVYLNGVLAADAARLHHRLRDRADSAPTAKAALKPGKNVIAVHCRQTGGGQYIDVGLVDAR